MERRRAIMPKLPKMINTTRKRIMKGYSPILS